MVPFRWACHYGVSGKEEGESGKQPPRGGSLGPRGQEKVGVLLADHETQKGLSGQTRMHEGSLHEADVRGSALQDRNYRYHARPVY